MSIFNWFKQHKGTGAIPDPIDDRDIQIVSFQEPVDIPAVYSTDLSMLPIWNQQATGSCVGQAIAKALQYFEYKENNRVIDLSPRFIYGMAKSMDNYPGMGTYPRVGANVARNFGCATTQTIPNNTSLSDIEYRKLGDIKDAVEEAKDFKVASYAYVTRDEESLKQAIYQNGIVTASLGYNYDGWAQQPISSRPVRSYHYVAIHGYDEEYFYFTNSWGNWSDAGIGKFKLEDVTMNSALSFVDVPSKILKEVVKPAKKYKYFAPYEIIGLKPELVEKLDEARGKAGIPFVITSGYRSKAQNSSVGGVNESSHSTGLAVDIRCRNSSERFKILKAFIEVGIDRIGIYNRHIHVDIDSTKPKTVAWMGTSH